MVAVRVALRVHTLSNEIGRQVSHIAILKLDCVNVSIEDGIVIGLPDGSTVGGVLARDDPTMLHFLAEWKKQFSQDIVVSNVRGQWWVIIEVCVIIGKVIVLISEVRGE